MEWWGQGQYTTGSTTISQLFMAATQEWAKDTCLKFEYGNSGAFFTVGSVQVGYYSRGGCYHQTHRTGSWLNTGCHTLGQITHELGHALGLGHTHNRHDRDNYINVNWYNVDAGFYDIARMNPGMKLEVYRNQFKPMTTAQNDNYDVPYDYGSIMHYGVPRRNPAMETNDPNYYRTIGSGLISFADYLMVNKHYKCDEICDKKTSAQCERGGFPNPNDCNTCVCPGGYGGPLCKDQPMECNEAKTLDATEQDQQVQINAYNQIGDRLHYFKCTTWIKFNESCVPQQLGRMLGEECLFIASNALVFNKKTSAWIFFHRTFRNKRRNGNGRSSLVLLQPDKHANDVDEFMEDVLP
ncbi:astacin [Ancylostoma duodenale]|uniref:Metalloendopeptidase n=1 Tax=Ancylostoma duodenale TaxID=51022 RepID=A0A0C2H4J7_9BILA|nr:astacin [Ancylostoma duodenale]